MKKIFFAAVLLFAAAAPAATTFFSFENMAQTTIAEDLTTGELDITVATGDGAEFPSSGQFIVTLYTLDTTGAVDAYELVLIDSRSSDVLTVNASGRGYESSGAQTWSDGDYIMVSITKASLTAIHTAINNLENDMDAIADATPEVDEIAAGSIDSDDFGAGVVLEDDIGNGAVTYNKIGSGAVHGSSIAASTITYGNIANETIRSTNILNGQIVADDIATDAVEAAEIKDGEVGSAEIATDAVTADEIATDAVEAAEIKDGEVGTAEIATDGVDSDEIAANAVGNSEIDNTSNIDMDSIDVGGGCTSGGSTSGITMTTTGILRMDQTLYLYENGINGSITLQFGQDDSEGMYIGALKENVSLTSGTSVSLTNALPSPCIIMSVQCEILTLVVGAGDGGDDLAKIGLSTDTDPDEYGITDDLLADSTIDTFPSSYDGTDCNAYYATGPTFSVSGCQSDGSAATETFSSGSVSVYIVYRALNSMD